MIRGYEVERLHLVNITPEQLADKIFREALELAIDCEIDEEEYNRFESGDYDFKVDMNSLTVTLDLDTQSLIVANRDFSRTSDFSASLAVIQEESELFGVEYF